MLRGSARPKKHDLELTNEELHLLPKLALMNRDFDLAAVIPTNS